jgi:hypothetical protein
VTYAVVHEPIIVARVPDGRNANPMLDDLG